MRRYPLYIWQFAITRENLPNVNTAIGGAPCFKTQASQFNFEKKQDKFFSSQHGINLIQHKKYTLRNITLKIVK
jgi:hypothetical protein